MSSHSHISHLVKKKKVLIDTLSYVHILLIKMLEVHTVSLMGSNEVIVSEKSLACEIKNFLHYVLTKRILLLFKSWTYRHLDSKSFIHITAMFRAVWSFISQIISLWSKKASDLYFKKTKPLFEAKIVLVFFVSRKISVRGRKNKGGSPSHKQQETLLLLHLVNAPLV